MKHFWDQRYAENETVYGYQPNQYFKLFIDLHKPGKILLPAEGEGRNALYAASKGWQVDAFDYSEVAREKALSQAEANDVVINYEIKDVTQFVAIEQYDAVALIYLHLPPDIRKSFHREIVKALKPGGFLLLEAFAKEQATLDSGGPRDPEMLYDAASICNDFQFLHQISCEQKEIILKEGDYHQGKAAILRMLAQKL